LELIIQYRLTKNIVKYLIIKIEPKTGYIHDLLVDLDFIEQQEQLMATFDKISERFGKKK